MSAVARPASFPDRSPQGRLGEAAAAFITAVVQEAAARAPADVGDQEAAPVRPLLLRVRDAAGLLGVGETKLRELLARRDVRALKVDGSTLVDYESLVEFRDRLREQQWPQDRQRRRAAGR